MADNSLLTQFNRADEVFQSNLSAAGIEHGFIPDRDPLSNAFKAAEAEYQDRLKIIRQSIKQNAQTALQMYRERLAAIGPFALLTDIAGRECRHDSETAWWEWQNESSQVRSAIIEINGLGQLFLDAFDCLSENRVSVLTADEKIQHVRRDAQAIRDALLLELDAPKLDNVEQLEAVLTYLGDVLKWLDNQIHASISQAWVELVASESRQTTSDAELLDRIVYKSEREIEFYFESERSVIRRGVGTDIIELLLTYPNQTIAATEFPSAASKQTRQNSHVHQKIPRGVALLSIDSETLSDCNDRLAQIRHELEQARTLEDCDQETRLREEHDKICSYVRKSTGLGNKPRSFEPVTDRARSRVAKAIRRVLDKLQPKLRDHLETCLNCAQAAWSYTPQLTKPWDFRDK